MSKCGQCGRIVHPSFIKGGICIYCIAAKTKAQETEAEVLGCPNCGHEKFWYHQQVTVECSLIRRKNGIELLATEEWPGENLTGFICDSCGQEFNMVYLESVYL